MIEKTHAFSLLEVVYATGLTALVVLGAMGLFLPLIDGVRESRERATAGRLLHSVTSALAAAEFESISTWFTEEGNWVLVADGSGEDWVEELVADDPVYGMPKQERFYRITVMPAGSDCVGPLDGLVHVVRIRVDWPYREEGSTTPNHTLFFMQGINR